MAYKEFGKQIHVENSEELVAEPVFCNQNIVVGNRIIFYKKKNWIDKGVCHIKNMLNDNGVIYCEATHVCYIENAREVTHVILMLLVEQG